MRFVTIAGLAAVISLTGCQTVYYDTMEKFGFHKRDILVDKIEDARDEQSEAKEQFKSALEQFTAVVNFDGGELEKEYNRLNDALSRSEAKAKSVHDSIGDVEDVAKALFKEWEQELTQYNNPEFKRESERQLQTTKTRYDQLMNAMRRAESKIEPVLVPFRDQVLFLKHNLNARAIASLQNELDNIETDVSALIKEMEESINEANAFIQSMGT
jgi:hypothetical protein